MCKEDHSDFKSWMSYKMITNTSSKQYKLIHSDKIKVGKDGLLYSGEYIGVALGSRYGGIGDKFILTLDTGKKVKVIKVDEKSDAHTKSGCHHLSDGSLIEVVIDVERSRKSYPTAIKMGDFNYAEKFQGDIVKIEKLVD